MHRNVLYAAVTGNYQVRGNPAEADCVIAQSFGTLETPDSVNARLAAIAVESGLPMILQQEVAGATRADAPRPALLIEGDPSNANGGGLTSWGVLKESKEFMDDEGLERPLLLAQAFHVGRAALQAKRILGKYPIVPSGLPRGFDQASTQPWTREKGLWVKREVPGLLALKLMRNL